LPTSRFEGCTLTGALSVTTHVQDGISIVHGPAGCAHHNFSLLHATLLNNDTVDVPGILSTGLTESDIIFGGEDALERCIAGALDASLAPASVFVISTCIVDTIGDDVWAISSREWGVPVIPIPTSGFLGGVFQSGFINALLALGDLAVPCRTAVDGVNLIGEKNLEYDVDENYREVSRLLAMLGLVVNVRLARKIRTHEIRQISAGALNILREPALAPVGVRLEQRFGTPYIDSFPVGLSGTLRFLRDAGAVCGRESEEAIQKEAGHQQQMLERFTDIRGASVRFDRLHPLLNADRAADELIAELAHALDLTISPSGVPLPAPYPAPVGTAGIRRMLHRWRKIITGDEDRRPRIAAR